MNNRLKHYPLLSLVLFVFIKKKKKNEEAVQRLAAKEKELETLKAQATNGSQEQDAAAELAKIEELNKQLEASCLKQMIHNVQRDW